MYGISYSTKIANLKLTNENYWCINVTIFVTKIINDRVFNPKTEYPFEITGRKTMLSLSFK